MSAGRLTEILVEESYKELLWLLRWFSNFGPAPTIVGGWAVYFYNSYFGSTDIDIVGPSYGGMFMDIIERYERAHGYEFKSRDRLGLEIATRKPIARDGGIVGYVEIDACTFENPVPAGFREDPSRRLPYSLADEESLRREVRLEEGAVCHIPSKPLLLLYKVKAARDRAYDLGRRGTVMDTAKREWLRGKLTKDRADMLALLDPNPHSFLVEEKSDVEAFRDLVRKLGLEFTLTAIRELPKHSDSIRLYSPTLKDERIREWVKALVK